MPQPTIMPPTRFLLFAIACHAALLLLPTQAPTTHAPAPAAMLHIHFSRDTSPAPVIAETPQSDTPKKSTAAVPAQSGENNTQPASVQRSSAARAPTATLPAADTVPAAAPRRASSATAPPPALALLQPGSADKSGSGEPALKELDLHPMPGSPAQSPGAAPAPSLEQRQAAYRTIIQDRFTEALHYPISARRRRLEGTADIRLHIRGDGVLADFQILTSTGFVPLDLSLQNAAEQSFPAPPPPDAQAITFVFPVRFQLR